LTEYVVTRWYRAPEVLLARSRYGPPVDVWSVGCIVYEMCSRKALFPGKNSYDQLKRILAVFGTPSESDISWVPRESVPLLQKCYPGGSSSQRGQSFASLCSSVAGCSSEGTDLLQQMCLFNPVHRIGVEQALLHPYLAGITSEQDRKTAKAVDPADVTYDKMFDGVGRQGEGAALVQLGRLLRREVGKFNPMRTDTTPERSHAERERTPKTANTSRTPRGGPQSTVEALVSAGVGGSARGGGSSKVAYSAAGTTTGSTSTPQQNEKTLGSSDRASSAHGRPTTDRDRNQPELAASVWSRRRSEPEVDVWARRSGQGTVVAGPGKGTSAPSSVPGSISSRRSSKQLDIPESKRVPPGEESLSIQVPSGLSLPVAPPASGPVPPSAFWLSEDKSPSSKLSQRTSARGEYSAGSVPSLRRRVPACSGGSATTVSTRATPPSSRPGTEASTRASSRLTSTSRPRVPSVGPSWAAEAEGFLIGPALGPMDAATASPRAGPPAVLHLQPSAEDRSHGAGAGQREEAYLSATRQNCWLSPEDAGESGKVERGSHAQSELRDRERAAAQRSLRESASTSHRGLPPDTTSSFRHESHSLASLDGVLREMKAMMRNVPDDSFRDEAKTQERSRHVASSKASATKQMGSIRSSTRPGLRGHRASGIGRGGETNDDRSPSQRATHRRQPTRTERSEHRSMGRQRSHDELDFAVSEPFAVDNAHTPQGGDSHCQAPTPPWAESRRPLEALEPEGMPSPDLGPPVPWSREKSVRTLLEGDQDWKNLQSSWNSAVINGHGKGNGGHHRQLSRTNSSAKRTQAVSENHSSNSHPSGLGFIF
jgi:serine/threonine protein kinase